MSIHEDLQLVTIYDGDGGSVNSGDHEEKGCIYIISTMYNFKNCYLNVVTKLLIWYCIYVY